MELLQLKYFAESAITENFSIVANKYFVPVSSVSSSVRKLEKELGCTLFDRYTNKIKLNQNGKIFFSDISAALNLISSSKEKLTSKNYDELGNINMIIRTRKSHINEKLVEFIKHNENVSFHITHSYNFENYTDYDLIVDEQSNTYKGFIKKPIIKEKIKIAASKNNPLSNKQLILSDLKHYPFITMSEGSSLNLITKKVCKNAGFNPNIIIESDDTGDIKKYIEEDFGLSFVSENFCKNQNRNISFLNVTDFDYSRITYLYLNENIKVSQAAIKFFEYIKEIS